LSYIVAKFYILCVYEFHLRILTTALYATVASSNTQDIKHELIGPKEWGSTCNGRWTILQRRREVFRSGTATAKGGV